MNDLEEWNDWQDSGEMDFEFPPVRPRKRGRGIKAMLWGLSAFLLVLAVGVIVIGMNNSRRADFSILFDDKSRTVPYNSHAESSYAADLSLPEAPQVSADRNGPQISVTEVSEEEISRFQSDFRVVADFFRQKRIGSDYIPINVEIKHMAIFYFIVDYRTYVLL